MRVTKETQENKGQNNQAEELRGQILRWYDLNARELLWRSGPGECADPYHVWLSEIMLQQTTVAAVAPYYRKFLQKWPTIFDLAAAKKDDVLREWAGLGYYARARNLHACAQKLAQEHNGVFPSEQKPLKALPGIGDYTSAAIRAIAFNKPATVMDGNIERVLSRYHCVEQPLPKSKPILKSYAATLFSDEIDRPGDLAQALMDLGAGVCTPTSPKCGLCPIHEGCRGLDAGLAETLPRKEKKKAKPERFGRIYWIADSMKGVLLHKRPEKGLLGGMTGLPTTEWARGQKDLVDIDFLSDSLTFHDMAVYHSFTHFNLTLHLYSATLKNTKNLPDDYFWHPVRQLTDAGLPSVFLKAVKAFQNNKRNLN